jgi:putative aldouronate transport system permease protein
LAKKTKGSESSSKEIVSSGEKIFGIINYIVLTVAGIFALYPFIYVLSASLSRGVAVDIGKVTLLPIGINFESYKIVLKDKFFWISYANTFFYTIVGSLFSMIISIPSAFALSKKHFRVKKIINLLLAFTMWFNVGFIPLFLNYKSLGVINNPWMIIISFGISAFNIILLRNYFEAIPESLQEAAKIDGANDFITLFKVYIPLSKPAITTVWLYYAIGRWNGFFWSTILLQDRLKIPLQVYLKQKIIDASIVSEYSNSVGGEIWSYNTIVYAIIVCSIIPVIIVYPWVQKHFTKGIMVGGVKE